MVSLTGQIDGINEALATIEKRQLQCKIKKSQKNVIASVAIARV
jgi:hypothetical protein